MNCENYIEMMDDFLDSSLSPMERDALEAHLKECGDCRGEIQSLQSLAKRAAALPRNLRPDRDLWPTIAKRIRITGLPSKPDGQKAAGTEAGGGEQSEPSVYRWAWRIAAAVAATVLLFAAAWLVTRQIPATSSSVTALPAPLEAQKSNTPPPIRGTRPAPAIPSLSSARIPGRTGQNSEVTREQRTEIVPPLTDTARTEPLKTGEGNLQVFKPSPPAPSDSSSGWALEVMTSALQPPAYLAIPDTGTFSVVVGNRRQKPESPPTGRLVRIRTVPQKNAVAVSVAVVDGSFRTYDMDDQGRPERMVRTFGARLGDHIRVDELQAFDIDPFELRVVSDGPAVLTPIQVANKTSSIRVIAVHESVGGRYQLTLRSLKMLRTPVGLAYRLANPSGTGMVNISIPPFGTAQILVNFGPRYQLNAMGQFEPDPRLPGILLSMVTFADGSYEGEAEAAALFHAQMRVVPQLFSRRILPLLTQALESWEASQADANAERLRAEIAAIPEDVELKVSDEIFQKYPAVARTPEFEDQLKSGFQSELKRQKRMMLLSLRENAEEDGRVNAAALRRWLADQKEIFEKILAKTGK